MQGTVKLYLKAALLCNVIPRDANDTEFMCVCNESPGYPALMAGNITPENPQST